MKKLLLFMGLLSSWVMAENCQITSPLPMPISIAGCTYSSALPTNSTSYIQNTSTLQSGATFYVSSGTVNTLAVSGISSGQCVQTSAGGLLTGTGSACGSGGGGGGVSGQINNANQYAASYYSQTGSSNVLSGLSAGTSGYILTTQGSAGPPFWSANLPPGSTNYLSASSSGTFIQNTSSLQSGATFYVSSGTITNQLNLTANGSGVKMGGSGFGVLMENGGGDLQLGTDTGNGAIAFLTNNSQKMTLSKTAPYLNIAGLTFNQFLMNSPAGNIDTADNVIGTYPLLSTSTLQSGAVLDVSSGTIAGPLRVTGLTNTSLTGGFCVKTAGSGIEQDNACPDAYLSTTNAWSGPNTFQSTTTISYSTMIINGVQMSWPSTGTVSGYLQYIASNTLQWSTPPGSGGGGSGIVSPGTFTWVNNSGIQVSTLAAINSTSPNTITASSSSTGVLLMSVSSAPAVSQTDYLLTVSSASGTMAFGVQNNSHMVSSGTTPSMGSCGVTPSGSVVGTDNAGTITVGGGVVTSCTLNFASTWGNTPVCVVSDNSTTIPGDISALSTSAMTVSFSASLGGGTVWYICLGSKG